jgi:large subunit ribosomal protein L25
MSIQEVVVTPRTGLGKGETKRLRKEGMIPSVVYGLGGDSVSVSVEPKTITKIIRSEKGLNSVLHLRLKNTEETRHVMIKDIDRHPVTDRLTHVDFLRINMDQTVSAVIPLRFEGQPEGVKLGGILTTVRHEVEIECLPNNLIGTIVVDVTHLGMDDALRVKDLPKFEGVTYQLGLQRTLAVVHAEKAVVVEEEEDEDVVDETPTV